MIQMKYQAPCHHHHHHHIIIRFFINMQVNVKEIYFKIVFGLL